MESEVKVETPNIEVWPIKKIKLYGKNHKKHSQEQVSKLAQSITRFGYTQPITINPKGTVMAGEGRYLAMKFLGVQNVPVIIKDLPEDEEKLYRIADNELSKFGVTYDFKIAVDELQNLKVDTTALGLANLKPQDFIFNIASPSYDALKQENESLSQKAFQDAEREMMEDNEEETDEEYLQNFEHKEENLNKENITLMKDNKPKTFHFYVEVKTELQKEGIKKEIEQRLDGLTCIVR